MGPDNFDWVDQQEERIKEERGKDYFTITEGRQQFVLLSHCAPLAQVYDPATKKYHVAQEGDKNVSVKGLCWVWQDDVIKQAKLPYTVVKDIRAISKEPDWDFVLPFPHALTLTAKNAGTKEVEYSLNASPKKVEIPQSVLDELAKKPTPEDVVEKIKAGNKDVSQGNTVSSVPYPDEDIDPADIPFD